MSLRSKCPCLSLCISALICIYAPNDEFLLLLPLFERAFIVKVSFVRSFARWFGLFHHFMSFGSIVPEINENLKSIHEKVRDLTNRKERMKASCLCLSCVFMQFIPISKYMLCVYECVYLFSAILFFLRSLSHIIYSWCCSSYSIHVTLAN